MHNTHKNIHPSHTQRGQINVLVVLMIALIVIVGGVGYWQSQKNAANGAALRVEIASKKAEEDKAQKEIAALQQQMAVHKTQDVLQTTLKAVDDLYARWLDASKIAGLSSRIAMAAPVAAVQAIKREADVLLVPDCLKAGKALMIQGMALYIDGLLAFMADRNIGELVARANFEEADKLFDSFEADRRMCPAAP